MMILICFLFLFSEIINNVLYQKFATLLKIDIVTFENDDFSFSFVIDLVSVLFQFSVLYVINMGIHRIPAFILSDLGTSEIALTSKQTINKLTR